MTLRDPESCVHEGYIDMSFWMAGFSCTSDEMGKKREKKRIQAQTSFSELESCHPGKEGRDDAVKKFFSLFFALSLKVSVSLAPLFLYLVS